jgi:hypothetical protein
MYYSPITRIAMSKIDHTHNTIHMVYPRAASINAAYEVHNKIASGWTNDTSIFLLVRSNIEKCLPLKQDRQAFPTCKSD